MGNENGGRFVFHCAGNPQTGKSRLHFVSFYRVITGNMETVAGKTADVLFLFRAEKNSKRGTEGHPIDTKNERKEDGGKLDKTRKKPKIEERLCLYSTFLLKSRKKSKNFCCKLEISPLDYSCVFENCKK